MSRARKHDRSTARGLLWHAAVSCGQNSHRDCTGRVGAYVPAFLLGSFLHSVTSTGKRSHTWFYLVFFSFFFSFCSNPLQVIGLPLSQKLTDEQGKCEIYYSMITQDIFLFTG